MALTKTSTTALSAVTTTQTSSAIDVSGAYAASVYAQIVQVGTATTAGQWSVQFSSDSSNYVSVVGPFNTGLAAATYAFPPIPVPPDCSSIKVAFTAQAGGTSSTFTAYVGMITSL